MGDYDAGTLLADSMTPILLAAFEHLPTGVGVCDMNGRFVAVNRSLAAMLGHRPEAMVGRPFLGFVHPGERASGLSTYFASIVAAECGRPMRVDPVELPCLTANGTVVWLAVNWTITPPDGAEQQYSIIHLTDVSRRKDLESELARFQQRFELAFTCAPFGIALVSCEGRFLQVNRAFQRLIGARETDLVDRSVAEIVHPADRAASLAVFDQLRDGTLQVHRATKRLVRRDGQTIHVRRVAAAARRPDGQLDHLVVLVEDLAASRAPERADAEPDPRDAATGLATLRQLRRHVEHTAHLPRSLVLVLIDGLSELLATLTEEEGRRLLARVGARISACCRQHDLIAQVGREEFAILVDDRDTMVGELVAARIVAEFVEPIVEASYPGAVTPRVGVDPDPSGHHSLGSMLHAARLRAGGGGRAETASKAEVADGDHPQTSSRELALEADLVQALGNGDLELAYQPIFRIADGAMVSVEALSRWTHPALGQLPPLEFIRIAERGSAREPLTRWALSSACQQLANWRAVHAAADELTVAVNISPRTFAAKDFPSMVIGCLADAGLDPRKLVLEITEVATAESIVNLIENAVKLRALGVGLALDDFGAGESTFRRIATLPITQLKLDHALTKTNGDQSVAAALLHGTVNIAADLNITLVAEGIETAAQLELLRRCGCLFAQGYLLAPPGPPADIAARLGTHHPD